MIAKRIAARKRHLQQRLDKGNYPEDLSQPMIRGGTPQYELSGRVTGTSYGGIGLIQQLVRELGLAEAIEQRLHLFKLHLPYHESDHVLNLAYNALCSGSCLEDLELRRQDILGEAVGEVFTSLRVIRRNAATEGPQCAFHEGRVS